jgi:hypothetical protein
MVVEQRANIKFCFKLGKKAGEAYEMLKSVYGSDCLSRSNIFRWYAVFRVSRDSSVGIATGYGWTTRGSGSSSPDKVKKKIFTSPYRPDRLWGPPNLL